MKCVRPWVCLCVCAILLAGLTTGAAAHLLPNGGFETGDLSGWSHGGGVTVVANDVRLAYKATAWIRIMSESGLDWGGFRAAVSDTVALSGVLELYQADSAMRLCHPRISRGQSNIQRATMTITATRLP